MPSETFSYTGSSQTWNVPSGVSQLTIELIGAGGGNGAIGAGFGGYGVGEIPVTGGDTVTLYVGEAGDDTFESTYDGGYGSRATGGDGAEGDPDGADSGGGGGGTRASVNGEDIAVGGGGGGGGDADEHEVFEGGLGGDGGGPNQAGQDGEDTTADTGGHGATTTSGGAGGTGGDGNGGDGDSTSGGNGGEEFNNSAGGGGGGWYGGGGGATPGDDTYRGGGGGGGSGYASSGFTVTEATTGGGADRNTNGSIVISHVVAPQNLTVDSISYRSASLSWDPVDGADSYNVYRDGNEVASGLTTTSYDDDVDPSTTFTWEVTAVDGGEESPKSDPATDSTGGHEPTNASASASLREVALSWDDTNDDEDGYEIHRSLSSGVDTSGTPLHTTGANATSYTDTGASDDGERYYYRIVAVLNNERGADSAEVDDVTDLPAPSNADSELI